MNAGTSASVFKQKTGQPAGIGQTTAGQSDITLENVSNNAMLHSNIHFNTNYNGTGTAGYGLSCLKLSAPPLHFTQNSKLKTQNCLLWVSFMNGLLRWQDILDIVIVAFIIYRIVLLIKGTRTIQLIIGLIVILASFFFARKLELFTLGWILNNFVGSILLVVVVLFQNEIRHVLLALGRSPFFNKITYVEETLFFDELVNACVIMSKRKIGALIVVQREAGLEEFMEIGIKIEADVNTELIVSIFHPASPLHDGALILQGGKIRAASCIVPLTMQEDLDKALGTRHRAGIGITEVTDAVAVVVSEESREISYAVGGEMVRNVTGEALKKVLKDLLA